MRGIREGSVFFVRGGNDFLLIRCRGSKNWRATFAGNGLKSRGEHRATESPQYREASQGATIHVLAEAVRNTRDAADGTPAKAKRLAYRGTMKFFHQFPYFRGSTFVAWVLVAAFLVVALLLMRGLERTSSRQKAFAPLIEESAVRHGVPPELVTAVIKRESDFFPWRVGRAGEVGLMQITEGAVVDWEQATGHQCPYRGMLFDPRLNIEIGTWYLGRALHRWEDHAAADALALAEYNAGYGNVRKWISSHEVDETLSWVRFHGTREYIKSIRKYRDGLAQGQSSRE